MTDKPLHVQVAEALGCRPIDDGFGGWICRCPPDHRERWGPHTGHVFHPCHDTEGLGCDDDIARYDTDWSATGPLIEKYRIGLTHGISGEPWVASTMLLWKYGVECLDKDWTRGGPTPLIAVCNLILALKAAGKL